MLLAPIVLFVYNRPWHTKQTLDALKKNHLANESVLYIYSDGAKVNASEEDISKIREVRNVIREENWCKEVHIIESESNKGLADSIVAGVTEVVNRHGNIIVLEDDIVTSPGFLKYMNDALEMYENEEKVMGVSGYMFPINPEGLPDTFFYRANTCWGWATWLSAWNKYNNDGFSLYRNLIEKPINWEVFNAFQGNAFKIQLIDNVEKRLETWAIKWHSVIHLNNGFVLHPSQTLVKNIGMDGSGVHCGINPEFDQKPSIGLSLKRQIIEESPGSMKALKDYFNKIYHPKTNKTKTKRDLIIRILKKPFFLIFRGS